MTCESPPNWDRSKRVPVELHDAGIGLLRFLPLDAAGFEQDERAGGVFDDLTLLGENRDALLFVAPVVDKYADQQPVRLTLANEEREAAVD